MHASAGLSTVATSATVWRPHLVTAVCYSGPALSLRAVYRHIWATVNGQSLPIQDEPGGGMDF